MDRKAGWGEGVFEFLDDLLEGDLHGKRVPSLPSPPLGSYDDCKSTAW